jgi:hypothetical protein
MVYGKAAGKNRGGAAALSTQHSRSVAYCMAGRIWGEKRAGFATTRRSPAGRPGMGGGGAGRAECATTTAQRSKQREPRGRQGNAASLPPPAAKAATAPSPLHAIGQPQVAALLVASRKRKEESERSLGRRGTPETQDAMRASKGPVWSCDLDSNPETVAAPDHDSSHCSTQYDLICLCLMSMDEHHWVPDGQSEYFTF